MYVSKGSHKKITAFFYHIFKLKKNSGKKCATTKPEGGGLRPKEPGH